MNGGRVPSEKKAKKVTFVIVDILLHTTYSTDIYRFSLTVSFHAMHFVNRSRAARDSKKTPTLIWPDDAPIPALNRTKHQEKSKSKCRETPVKAAFSSCSNRGKQG
jgi:hypothetical protein